GHDRADCALGSAVRRSGRVRRAVRGHIPLGGQLRLAGLRRHRHEHALETPGAARSVLRRADARHDGRRADGYPAADDPDATRSTEAIACQHASQGVAVATMTFGKETTTDELLEGRTLSGRRMLVTGGTSGLGLETARVLAAHGAHVVITARDADKAERAVATIRAAAAPGATVE